jgi:uncharacterized membrane protein
MSKSLTNRRRSTPWIQRWARQIIGAIAVLGILDTAYLTATRFLSAETICPTSGCEKVLSSAYATAFGLPISLFGLLAYTTMAVLALAPLLLRSEEQKPLRAELEPLSWTLLFIGATAMTIFSGYLMFIMVSQFVVQYGLDGVCYYCLFSATCAIAMFVLTLLGQDWEDIGQLLFIGIIVVMVTLIGTLALYAPINSPNAEQSSSGQVGPAIANTSSGAEIELAKYLKQIGAKMYGAYWCPHCHDQKELFGKEAFSTIQYVECAPTGKDAQTALCEKIVPTVEKQTGRSFGFPTWEIKGKFYSGTQSLEELSKISGYTGPRNFKNSK